MLALPVLLLVLQLPLLLCLLLENAMVGQLRHAFGELLLRGISYFLLLWILLLLG